MGLSLSTSGTLSGTPSTANLYFITISVTDSLGHAGGPQDYALTISAGIKEYIRLGGRVIAIENH